MTSAIAIGGRSSSAFADEVAGRTGAQTPDPASLDRQLAAIDAQPVLRIDELTAPLVLDSIEVLRAPHGIFIRVRTADGHEGVSIGNLKLIDTLPILMKRVLPGFAGTDARDLEQTLVDLYRRSSNYKWQGLAFWIGVAAVEMAVLDLLGRAAGKPLGELLAPVRSTAIGVYRASGNRGNSPADEIDHLHTLADEIGANHLKFRLGGRMSANVDSAPGRTEALLKLAREEFGDDAALYGDSNSSYDVAESLRIGRLMEDLDYEFFEEPVPFDHLWETKQLTETLDIPIAGGEQEFSNRRFRWSIANRVMDIVQPDLQYHGGLVRSYRVARMAAAAGLTCTPHQSGGGLAFVYLAHFASCLPNAGKHQEYKGLVRVPCECDTSSLKPVSGVVQCPTGPGLGVIVDAGYLDAAKRVR